MSTPPERSFTRRQFLPGAAGVAALGVAGLVGYELHPAATASSSVGKEPVSGASGLAAAGGASFVSRPDLRPPAVSVTQLASGASVASSRFVCLATETYVPDNPTQQGLMIVDRQGRLVWFQPFAKEKTFDLNVQSDRGRPVLTWWQGTVANAHGYGVGKLADDSYRTTATLHAGHHLTVDLHELQLTSAGTALVTAYEGTTTDLSSIGGSRRAKVFTGHLQEIDPATGKVLFDWNSLDHVGVQESYQGLPHGERGTFDYFHINSIAEMDDGNLLVSARNTWALYKIDRSTGQVLWRLGGKRSDFSLAREARFYWQHHARPHGASALTVFDNASPKTEKRSRGLLLALDTKARHVKLTQAYLHPAGFLCGTLGSVQLLPGGRVFVGWGTQPYFSEFDADGTLLLDGHLPYGVRSYRAFLVDWVGKPQEPPAVAARSDPASGFTVFASWNGATEVDHWSVLAGATKSSLTEVGSQQWSGFETAIAVNSQGPYFCVVARDARGRELGRSEVV